MAESVEPDDLLLLEPRKVVSYHHTRVDGSCVLRVSYGRTALEFEGDSLPIGQRIFQSERARFRAGDAADGLPLAWDDVSDLLASLLAEKVLRREDTPEDLGAFPPPQLCTDARAPMPPLRWRSLEELCVHVSSTLGHAVRPEVAETSIGARMISQLVRDDEGRQGGENGLAMVAPMLTDAVPTEWRPCKYSGSRFDDPRPMNVSSLRQVQAHMPAVLAVTSTVRARYLQRSGLRQLDLGHLCILAEVLNVLPAWLLVRPRAPVASGEQPAWVHSVAKTIAGIDMSLRYLVDESEEHELDSPVTSADIHRAADFGGLFATATGVCSGTAAMIDRANRAFTGEDVAEGGETLLATCCAVDELLDYGLAWCRLVSARMVGECLALETVEAALASDPIAREGPVEVALLHALSLERQSLDREEGGSLERRIAMLERKFRGADQLLPTHEPDALESLSREARPSAPASSGLLRAGLQGDVWAPALSEVLALERRTLVSVRQLQQDLDTTIGRARVVRVERADLAAARRLRGRELLSEPLARFLGVAVTLR